MEPHIKPPHKNSPHYKSSLRLGSEENLETVFSSTMPLNPLEYKREAGHQEIKESNTMYVSITSPRSSQFYPPVIYFCSPNNK